MNGGTGASGQGPGGGGRGPFVPLLVMALAMLLWTGFQTVQLVRERSLLRTAREGQAQQIEQSYKLRTALDTVAARTARLADSGNANARLIVDRLKQRGITIQPDRGTEPPPQ